MMRTQLIIWGVAALGLIAAEMFVPGAFLMWLGFAAGALFFILLLLPGLSLMTQAVLFVLLAFFFIWVYRRFFRRLGPVSAEPALNRRAHQLIGQTFTLQEPLRDGVGRAQIADAFWTLRGAELTVGTRVRVVATDGMVLEVEPA